MTYTHKVQAVLLGLAGWCLVAAYFGIKLGRFLSPAPRLFGFTLPERFR